MFEDAARSTGPQPLIAADGVLEGDQGAGPRRDSPDLHHLRGWAMASTAVLTANVVWLLITAGFVAALVRVFRRVLDGQPVTAEEVVAASPAIGFSLLSVVLFLLAAETFLVWFFFAYRNLDAIGAPRRRYAVGWALGAWFVPMVNLVRPKRIADEIWLGSMNAVPVRTGHGGRGTPGHVVHLWWALLLAVPVVAVGGVLGLEALVERANGGAEPSLDAELASLAGGFAISVVSDVLLAAAGVACVFMVHRVSRAQQRAAVAPERRSFSVAIWAAVAAGAVVATVLAVAMAREPYPSSASLASAVTVEGVLDYFEWGDADRAPVDAVAPPVGAGPDQRTRQEQMGEGDVDSLEQLRALVRGVVVLAATRPEP